MNVDKPDKIVVFSNRDSAMKYYRCLVGWKAKFEDAKANALWRKWYQ